MRQGRHDGRVGVSLSPEAVKVLDDVRDELIQKLGFAPSYAQTILHICRELGKVKRQEQIDAGVEVFHNQVMKDSDELSELGGE